MQNIYKISSHPVVDFAAEELKKYLRMMMPRAGEYAISYDPDAKDGFRLGLMSDFSLPTEEVKDDELDDILYANAGKDGGIIAGSNPRSVLLSVYQFLRENGCRWLFPGIDGEYIPMRDVENVQFRKVPSLRYRAQCNEGAETQQCVLDAIDFTAKIGMNTFMLEFDIPYTYYKKYYEHRYNPAREPEAVSVDTVLQWKRATEVEIGKRGLRLFDMGHGWTAESFGISSISGWDAQDASTIPEEMRQYLALVDGKRDLYHGVALNTNICMSNPKARQLICKRVLEYAKQAENVHCLKISLADYMKNHCECEECRKMRPSDWYVKLLNEIDETLCAAGLNQRLGFTIYSDTTWEPEHEYFHNPDHFLGNLAAISRSYLASSGVDPQPKELTPYIRNVSGRLDSMDEYLWHANEWRKQAGCMLFAYEYHFWKAQFYCPSPLTFAKRVNEDIISYHKNRYVGVMEDCSQRNFFPNALAFSIYAQTLFDVDMDYDAAVDDYFTHAYGDAKGIVKTFFEKLETYMPQKFVDTQHTRPVDVEKYHDKKMIPSLEKAIALCDKLDEDLKPYRNMPHRVQTVAVRLLGYFTEYLRGLAQAFILKCGGDDIAAKDYYTKFFDEFGKKERDIEPYYDHYLVHIAFNPIFNSGNLPEM